MTLLLEPRQVMGQPKAYGIAERVGGVRVKLSGACATAVPLGKVLKLDPKLSMMAGEGKAKKDDITIAGKRDLLKEKIINLHRYNSLTKNDVMFTNGTYEANFLIMSEAVDPGEEIIVIRPCWYQFAAYKIEEQKYSFCCGGLQSHNKTHLLTRCEEENWRYPIEELKEVVSKKTALIIVNSPDNPTGNSCTNKEMEAICDIAKDCGAYVLHDEIYRGTEWDKPFSSPQALNYYDKAIATNSLSKSLGWDGLRLGWLATRNKEFFERAKAVNEWLHMGQSGAISTIQLEVGLAALERKKFMELLDYGRKPGIACWNEMDKWMSKHKDVFKWQRPMAAFLSFPSYNLKINSWQFCEKLAAEPYSTAVIPGIAYGMEKHLRLGVGRATPKEVKTGLEQIEKVIETL